MSNTHKNKTVLAITTSRGLGRYAARITVGNGPTLATAMRKAKEIFPELDMGQFADAFADERNEMAGRSYTEESCEGHPAGSADHMGQTTYCDGSCRSIGVR